MADDIITTKVNVGPNSRLRVQASTAPMIRKIYDIMRRGDLSDGNIFHLITKPLNTYYFSNTPVRQRGYQVSQAHPLCMEFILQKPVHTQLPHRARRDHLAR